MRFANVASGARPLSTASLPNGYRMEPGGRCALRYGGRVTAARVDIVGYRVIATREDPLRVYQVELPASAREVPIPAAFLQSDTEYELEIQAIEESGNWTFAMSFFSVT
jgi:hypothetical protein